MRRSKGLERGAARLATSGVVALSVLALGACIGGETSRSEEQDEVGAEELSAMLWVSNNEL